MKIIAASLISLFTLGGCVTSTTVQTPPGYVESVYAQPMYTTQPVYVRPYVQPQYVYTRPVYVAPRPRCYTVYTPTQHGRTYTQTRCN